MDQLLTATQVAEHLQVTRAWVYGHAQELGAVRLGDGRKPRLRFDAQRIREGLRPVRATAADRQPLALVRGDGLDTLPPRWRDAVDARRPS